MKDYNNIRGCLELSYINLKGKEKTKYFRDISSLKKFLINSNIFICDIYVYDKHEYIYECDIFDKFIVLSLIKDIYDNKKE